MSSLCLHWKLNHTVELSVCQLLLDFNKNANCVSKTLFLFSNLAVPDLSSSSHGCRGWKQRVGHSCEDHFCYSNSQRADNGSPGDSSMRQ